MTSVTHTCPGMGFNVSISGKLDKWFIGKTANWTIYQKSSTPSVPIQISFCPFCGERLDPSDAAPCAHTNAVMVESYYSDTEWCPECGASRGTDGKFGPGSKMLEWKLPESAKK